MGGPVSWVEWSLRESPGLGSPSQLMESQIWHPSASSVALWFRGGRVQRRDNGLCPPFCPPALALMPNTSASSCIPQMLFKLLPQFWSSEGVSLSNSICGFFKRNCWVLQRFFPQTQSLLVFATRTYLPGTGILGWRVWCETGTPHSQDNPPEFLSTTHECEISPLCKSIPPISLDGCGFFNSVVVTLQFNSIPDSSE